MKLTIRPAVMDDAPTLADYNAAMAWETEHLKLDLPTLDRGVRAALADVGKARYLVAECGGRVIGQLMITFEWSDWRNANIWWIQSVYVHPEHRRRGVFRSLYRHVETLARQEQAAALRLYVEQENTAAQQTYRSLGMEMTYYRVMEQKLGEPL